MRMEEHHIIGTIVIIAIVIIAVFGMFLLTKKEPGKAIEILDSEYLGYYCSCIKDNYLIRPFYTMQDFVIINGEKISINKIKNTQNPCPEICAGLGGFARY